MSRCQPGGTGQAVHTEASIRMSSETAQSEHQRRVFEDRMTLHSVQVDLDVIAAVRALALAHTARHDADYLIKTVLTEALGGPILRPWAIHAQTGSVVSVLGYSALSAGDVEKRLGTA